MEDRKREPTPAWVKWGGAVLVVLVLGGVLLSATGASHGPGRHLGGTTAPAGPDAP